MDKYNKEISDPDNGYDGLWLWKRRDMPEALSELFKKKADLSDVQIELKSWINSHPQ